MFAPRFALLVVLLGLPAVGDAQGVVVSPGFVDIEIPLMGTEFGVGVDTSSILVWEGSPNSKSKITVQSLATYAAFDLTVEAVAVERANSVGAVPLTHGMSPRDLIVNIKKAVGRNAEIQQATLRYEARVGSAGPAAAGLFDNHIVLFTITQQ